jgi:hypothetical protein
MPAWSWAARSSSLGRACCEEGGGAGLGCEGAADLGWALNSSRTSGEC